MTHWSRWLSLTAVVVALGCTKPEPDPRRADAAAVELIVADDMRASKAMAEADAAARRGDTTAALAALDQQAGPAIDAGLRRSAATEPKTDWGRARRDAFTRVLERRRAELGPYREAVTSGDPERLIAAMQAQAAIERQAIAAVADAHDGRPPADGVR